jgi:hypothetical protein
MKFFSIIPVCLVLLFSSCIKGLEPGKLVTYEEYLNLAKVKENADQRFAIVGYPFIGGDIKIGMGTKTQISFYEEADGKGRMIANFPIMSGTSANEFDVPENFTMADVKFFDNEGKELKSSEKMQVSFTLVLQTDRERSGSGDDMKYYGGPESIRLDKAK